ncbi:MAG TPA: zf-HC2 domain-containing protein [Terriglobales bacterium]
MDHESVVREKMTEKYLLEELDPEMREEFEEHFFACPVCALDIRAGSAFVTRSKVILAETSKQTSAQPGNDVPDSAKRGWWAWPRPAFAVPVMALLLAVVGYQNLVTLPKLTHALNQPRVLTATTVNLLTYGANSSPLVVHRGEGFLLNVIIPPGRRYPAYKLNLYNPAGVVDASIPISASAEDTWPVSLPAANWQSGSYKLTVYGVTETGQDVEVGSGFFELQVQK